MQTEFQHQIVAVFFVILLTKNFRFFVETISGTKLKVHSLFDRHLLMNNHTFHQYYVPLNQKSGNGYAVKLIFFLIFGAKWASGETETHGDPALYVH